MPGKDALLVPYAKQTELIDLIERKKYMDSENKKPIQGGAVKCDKCDNTGKCAHCKGERLIDLKQEPCKYCQGSGTCPTCNCQGWILVSAIEHL